MKTPGVSLTIGMSQDTGTPYARVTGRKGGFVLGKKLDFGSQNGLIALAAGLLVVNAVKKTKKKSANKKVTKAKDVSPTIDLGGFLSKLVG